MISLPSTKPTKFTYRTTANSKNVAYVPDAYSKGFYELQGTHNLEVTHKIEARFNIYEVSFTAYNCEKVKDLPTTETSTFKEIRDRIKEIEKELQTTTSVKDLEKLKKKFVIEYHKIINLKNKLYEELNNISFTCVPGLDKIIDAKIKRQSECSTAYLDGKPLKAKIKRQTL